MFPLVSRHELTCTQVGIIDSASARAVPEGVEFAPSHFFAAAQFDIKSSNLWLFRGEYVRKRNMKWPGQEVDKDGVVDTTVCLANYIEAEFLRLRANIEGPLNVRYTETGKKEELYWDREEENVLTRAEIA